MADPIHIIVLPLVYDYVTQAAEVQVMPLFGCSEQTVKITKAEARRFLDTIPHNSTVEAMEMSTKSWATYYPDTQVLILG